MSGRPPHRAELRGASPVGLVTVTYAGRVFRFSTRPVEIIDADGVSLAYDGGLDGFELDTALAESASEPDYPSVPVSAVFPVDIASLVAQGYDLSMATAEVAIHIEGQTWEHRYRIVESVLHQPVYGEDGEPCDFSVEQVMGNDGGLFPDPAAIVSADTWSGAPSNSLGLPYPWVFGNSGKYTTVAGASATTSGSEGIVVEVTGSSADTLLVSDGHVEAVSVTVFGVDPTTGNEASASATVTNTTDGLGRQCATADISGLGATIDRLKGEFWIGWGGLGGALSSDRTHTLSGAGEVMEAVLRYSTVPLDRGRWAALAPKLNSYKLAGVIEEPVGPWAWVLSNVLPLVPVTLIGGPDGVYPVIWPLDATATDAVESLVEGVNCTRVSRVTYVTTPREQFETVSLQYAARQKTSDYRRSVLLRSTTSDQSAESHAAYLARRGTARGAVASKSETSDILYDAPTATRVAAGWLRAALPVREVEYECGVEMGWLQSGSVVLLTDTGIHQSGQVATVARMAWASMSAVRMTLEIRSTPTRDARKLP